MIATKSKSKHEKIVYVAHNNALSQTENKSTRVWAPLVQRDYSLTTVKEMLLTKEMRQSLLLGVLAILICIFSSLFIQYQGASTQAEVRSMQNAINEYKTHMAILQNEIRERTNYTNIKEVAQHEKMSINTQRIKDIQP